MIIFSKLKDRLVEYKSCRAYLGTALLQLATVLVLVSLAFRNINEIFDPPYQDDSFPYFKFQKMVFEALVCIIFEGWKVILIIDAVLEVNILLIYSINGLSIFSFVIYLSASIEYVKLIEILTSEQMSIDLEISLLDTNRNLMIACTCISFIFIIINIWISRKVVKDFGWGTFRKLGASIAIKKMYKVSQFFSVILKLDVIFELVYIILVIVNTRGGVALLAFQIPIPVAIFLSILFAREAIARESHILMVLFYCAQVSLIGTLIAIFSVPATDNPFIIKNAAGIFLEWYAFAIYTIIAAIFCIATIVLGILCEINFRRGLKPYVQWSFYGLRRSYKRASQVTKLEVEESLFTSKQELIDEE